MKKLILILTTIFLFYSCEGGSGKYRYVILDNRGMIYECNFYNENEDGCIMFNNRPGEDNTPGTPTIICGNYTIKKIK
jgi:hypothetical protein